MNIARSSWAGRLSGRRSASAVGPTIATPLKPSPRGGSGTFLAADEHGRQWWVKPLNNKQGERVTITDAVVGAMGAVIGAPTCVTTVVTLPSELRGWEFRPGSALEPGLAHASSAVGAAVEDRQLLYRDRDDNRRRHAGVFALYDWCWGGDDQWLYSQAADAQLFSHDHGWYLPEVGLTWSEATLTARVGDPHPASWPSDNLDNHELTRLADRLRSLTSEDLLGALSTIPTGWPVSDGELEAVGWFLQCRAEPVADRLEIYRGGTT